MDQLQDSEQQNDLTDFFYERVIRQERSHDSLVYLKSKKDFGLNDLNKIISYVTDYTKR